MKNATEMKIQNSDAFGVGTKSVTELGADTSIRSPQKLLASICSSSSTDKILLFIEEAKAYSFLRKHGAASIEDLQSIGVQNPSATVLRLRNVGLPIETLYACYYEDQNGDRKYAACLYTLDGAIFSNNRTNFLSKGGACDGK